MFFILAKSPTPLEMLLILPSKIFWNMAGSPAMFAYTIVAIHVRRCSNRFSPTPIDVIEFADVTGYNSMRCISVGLRYLRTGYPNRNRQFCKESEPEI